MPAVTHRSLGFYLALLERMVDRERVASTTFTAVMNFTGSGGGAWTIAVKDGVCRVTEGAADRPNLALTQSPDAFVASFTKVKNPMVLMLTGKIKVKGFGALGTFGKLFPPPSADPRRTWPVTTEPAAA
jgi:putative sterol carrier protein